MGKTRYVEHTEEQVAGALEAAGFERVRFENVAEMVYGRTSAKPGIAIVIYTSVVAGKTRDTGEDAGRVLLMTVDEKILWSATAVHRTKNFVPNLIKRARDAWRWSTVVPDCPKCGAHMAIRTNKKTKANFFGCSEFPKCKGVVSYVRPKEARDG